MAREALKALSRVRLKYSDIPGFFETLNKESERMAAILAAAGVEDGLEFAIQNQHMPNLSKTEFESVFDSDDMLGTFGSKIKMGHALRLYGDITRADMTCIKDVRNAFAHAKMHLDFQHPAVIEACGHLTGPFGRGTEEKELWAPKERFLETAKFLYLELLDIATERAVRPAEPRLP